MSYPINCKEITPVMEFYSEVIDLYERATNYLITFNWCKEIKNSYLYTNIGKVFCIFLFEIENTASASDSFLWIIVGDIPSMYLDTHGPNTVKYVIEDYISLSEDWINAVKKDQSVSKCFPFNAEPTVELANLLESRVAFMKHELIKNVDNLRFKHN